MAGHRNPRRLFQDSGIQQSFAADGAIAFHGIDPAARFKLADEKLKTAQSSGQLLGTIAQVLLDLNDSHTFFVPPQRASRVEYGWQMKPVGADCYVSAVKPGSNAEAGCVTACLTNRCQPPAEKLKSNDEG